MKKGSVTHLANLLLAVIMVITVKERSYTAEVSSLMMRQGEYSHCRSTSQVEYIIKGRNGRSCRPLNPNLHFSYYGGIPLCVMYESRFIG